MTEEEYLRMKNILNAIIEQQAVFGENHRKADARMAKIEARTSNNTEAIAALLTLAEMHEQGIAKTNEQMNTRFQQIAATFDQIGKRSAETDERINAWLM